MPTIEAPSLYCEWQCAFQVGVGDEVGNACRGRSTSPAPREVPARRSRAQVREIVLAQLGKQGATAHAVRRGSAGRSAS
jgi:hypothetical protein